jgi:hypothetical protein
VPFWYDSADVDLRAPAEAFASPVMPGALEAHRLVRSAAPLPDRWRRGVEQIAAVGGEWWGWGPAAFDAPRERADRRLLGRLSARRPVARRRTALTFSGGVDSFHALLKGGVDVDLLVTVHGFDIGLDDGDRMAAWERSFREIAAELGIPAGVVRTNVRDHPTARLASWPRAHGGALAGLGHALAGVDRLAVASSYPRRLASPWGSHWRIDPLWSSDRLEVLHVGDEWWRAEKLAQVADHPLVHRYLRVCWEHRSPALNCGRCEKCVRTQLVLETVGRLADMRVFPAVASLRELVDEVPRLENPPIRQVYLDLAEKLPADVAAAVHRLVERSSLAP